MPNCKPISVGRPSGVRYKAPSHHPTTPEINDNKLAETHDNKLAEVDGNKTDDNMHAEINDNNVAETGANKLP